METNSRRRVTDNSLTVLATLLLIELIVLQPLVATGWLDSHWTAAGFVAVLALAVWLLFDRTAAGKLFFFMASIAVVLNLAKAWRPDSEVILGTVLFTTGGMLTLTWLCLLYTLAPGRVNMHRVFGAIAAFLLIGMAFTQAHRLLATYAAGAYLLLGQPATAEQIVPLLHYYSFVTLTSLGFGDITPLHPLARSLTVLEALVGVLYPVALLGWLVSHVARQVDDITPS
jgi:hypothetical protein